MSSQWNEVIRLRREYDSVMLSSDFDMRQTKRAELHKAIASYDISLRALAKEVKQWTTT